MKSIATFKKGNTITSANTNMLIFLIGKMFSLFGARIFNFAMGLYVLRVTGSGMSFALTMIVSTIPAIIISPFAGVLADRSNRRTVVIITDGLCGVVLIGAYIVATSIGLSLNLVLITVFLLSICNTFFNITMEASIPNLVDERRLTKINSYNSSITSLAAIVGPALGGFIYGFIDIAMFMFIAGIGYLLSAFSETFINFNFNNNPMEAKSKGKVLKEIKTGFDYVKSKQVVFSILLFAVFINFVFSGYTVTLPHIVNIQLGLTSDQYGLIQSSTAIGSMIFSLLYSLIPDKKKKYRYLMSALVIISILMMITGIPTLPRFHSATTTNLLLYFMTINFFIGGALMFLNLPAFILIQRETSDEFRGRVNGLLGTMSLSIQPLGMVLGGLFTDYISSFILVLICGILFLATSLLFLKSKELKEAL